MSVTSVLVCVGLMLGCMLCVSCAEESGEEPERRYSRARQLMVDQVRRHGVSDERVLAAMGRVRRHVFIPESHRFAVDAYGDHPCTIGHGQTISQPFIVAYMTEMLRLKPGEKVLEIGTGSGYQAAVLAELGVNVFSIEIVRELAEHARGVLRSEGYSKVLVLTGDGYKGWAEHAPFDAVIVTCAPEDVPDALVEQLKEGGRLIAPVGRYAQRLVLLRKRQGKVTRVDDLAVRFVPMVHEEEEKQE